jgi:hypothetical protein
MRRPFSARPEAAPADTETQGERERERERERESIVVAVATVAMLRYWPRPTRAPNAVKTAPCGSSSSGSYSTGGGGQLRLLCSMAISQQQTTAKGWTDKKLRMQINSFYETCDNRIVITKEKQGQKVKE